MDNYYIMECNGVPPITRIYLDSEIDDAPWMSGEQVEQPSGVIEYSTDRRYPGNLKALISLSIPLMRKDLLAVIFDSGADNLEVFDAIINDGANNALRKDYKAFNILGKVSGADMSQSSLMHQDTITGVDHDFDRLFLDEEKIPSNLKIFRLAESVNAIVVHRKIKESIEMKRIEGIVFFASGEWSG